MPSRDGLVCDPDGNAVAGPAWWVERIIDSGRRQALMANLFPHDIGELINYIKHQFSSGID